MHLLIAITAFLALHRVPALYAQEHSPDSPAFLVIINTRNPATNLERKFLSDVFFKKVTRWPDDSVIEPADQKPDSPVRRKFSETVLNRSIAAMKNHWQQLIFSGRGVPPPELASDEEVLQYVLKHPGAIGYISGSAKPSGVKTVSIK